MLQRIEKALNLKLTKMVLTFVSNIQALIFFFVWLNCNVIKFSIGFVKHSNPQIRDRNLITPEKDWATFKKNVDAKMNEWEESGKKREAEALAAEEKKLKEENKKLTVDNYGFQRKIEENKKKIEENKKKIEENNKALALLAMKK